MGEKGGAVGVLQADDMGDGMQCMDHPYRSNPGGICAFCLQEKLGKLVTSSKLTGPFFPLQPPLSASSSSSPAAASFRSADAPSAAGGGVGLGSVAASSSSRTGNIGGGGARTRIPILSANGHKKKKSGSGGSAGGSGVGSRKVTASAVAACTSSSLAPAPAIAGNNATVVLKRSKSVATRPVGGHAEGGARHGSDSLTADSPRKKSFWSFLYLSSSSSSSTATSSSTSNTTTSNCNNNRRRSTSSYSGAGEREANKQQLQQQPQQHAATDDKDPGVKMAAPRRSEHISGDSSESPMNGSQATSSSFGRKVERSRSVGCGSRSFSGDFLERISTGFGDCTLRRVESHRESKPKMSLRLDRGDDEDDDEQQRRRMKERIKCGGLFGGFGMALASSFWLSAAVDDDFDNSSRISSATPTAAADVRGGHNAAATPHGRARHWGWAFASPMRAFRPAASSKSLYTIKSHAHASAAATNAISAINASNKLGKLGH